MIDHALASARAVSHRRSPSTATSHSIDFPLQPGNSEQDRGAGLVQPADDGGDVAPGNAEYHAGQLPEHRHDYASAARGVGQSPAAAGWARGEAGSLSVAPL